MNAWLKRNAKTVTAAVGCAGSWAILVLLSPSGPITGAEVASGIGMALTTFGINRIPNAEPSA
jgi:hypothetical protein